MKDGGTAFPNFERRPLLDGRIPALAGGMSLRDYFAAAALPAIINRPHWPSYLSAAEGAYGVADAMLAEREKQ